MLLQTLRQEGDQTLMVYDSNSGCIENTNSKTDESTPILRKSTSSEDRFPSSGTKSDECDEGCYTFCSSDLLSFAWQIARGMVSSVWWLPRILSCNRRVEFLKLVTERVLKRRKNLLVLLKHHFKALLKY